MPEGGVGGGACTSRFLQLWVPGTNLLGPKLFRNDAKASPPGARRKGRRALLPLATVRSGAARIRELFFKSILGEGAKPASNTTRLLRCIWVTLHERCEWQARAAVHHSHVSVTDVFLQQATCSVTSSGTLTFASRSSVMVERGGGCSRRRGNSRSPL